MSNDDGRTARLGLPLIEPGQAQKEMTHNEALALVDLVVQASVVAAGVNDPPAAPAIGACWIVGATPTGAWTGQAQGLAGWTAGGWRFVAARRGMAVWREDTGVVLRHDGTAWQGPDSAADLVGGRVVIGGDVVVRGRGGAIPAPTGGTVVDAASRTAIGAILSALRAHGLIAV